MQSTDLDYIAEMMADPEVMRHYPKPLGRAEAAAWIDRQRARYEADGHGLWAIEDPRTGEPLGQVGLVMQVVAGFDEPRYPEIGYMLRRPFWKRGLATEAAMAVRAHAFGLLCYDQVISLVRPVNLPSQGVARRLGMTVRGTTTFAGFETLVFGISRATYDAGHHPV